MKHSELFQFPFDFSAEVDVGMRHSSNQDAVICCSEHGFFAVSDGMGGLRCGGETSELLAKALPERIRSIRAELAADPDPEKAAELLAAQFRHISDNIFSVLNQGDQQDYGATLCGVWLVGDHAVFVNMGDSRGYLLGVDEQGIRKITSDHNLAALLVASGYLNPNEARGHGANAELTRFVGMKRGGLTRDFCGENPAWRQDSFVQ